MNIGGKHLFRLHSVFAGEAGGAEAAVGVLGQLDNVLRGEVAQRVGANDLVDLVHRAAGSDQKLLVGDVGAKVAGIFEGGCRNAEVTSFAPASRSSLMMRAEVVPRTMESSTSTTRLPLTVLVTTFSLMRTLFSRCFWLPWMKVRPMYLFLIKPMP